LYADDLKYNTYASPPNSELLRKYGHVDTLELSPDLILELSHAEVGGYAFGNAGDEVEISGDLLVDAAVAAGHVSREGPDGAASRVDWWLDEGQADAFSITYPSGSPLSVVPPALWAFARLLTREEDWERAKRGKLPKPKDDDPVSIQLILAAITARAAKYPQTVEVDLSIVKDQNQSLNLRNAAAVRIGEKRVLTIAVRNLHKEVEGGKRKAKAADTGRSGKRSKK
jgi:SET domain-containing protein 6